MFGIKFIKFEPNTFVLKYKSGKIKQEGDGLSFFYYAPTTSLVAIPISSSDVPFIFSEATSDYQEITVQGQATFRISEPKKISKLLSYNLDAYTHEYISDDPDKLPQRLVNIIRVIIKNELKSLNLREALNSSEKLAKLLQKELPSDKEVASLGLEILGFSILAIKPTPETSKALEAQTREQILKESDEAIFLRRNSAVEQERSIRENELNTEIAVENKNREIMETRMDADKSAQLRQQQMTESEMNFNIAQEEKNKKLVSLKMENSRAESDAKAYSVSAVMKSFSGVDPAVIQSLATVGMQPDQLIALAFQGLAEKADKIGELNVSPELLSQLIKK